MSRALTKLQAIIILVVVIIAAASAAIFLTTRPSPAPTTTTPTTPATTPTTTPTETTPPGEYTIQVGDVTIKVSSGFYDFVQKAKAGQVKVKIYFGHALGENERPAFQKIISDFQAEYPGIEVVEIPYAQMDQLKAQISAIAALPPEQRSGYVGQVPDVFTWAHDWIGEFADKGYIIPLDEVLSRDVIVGSIAPKLMGTAYSAVVYKLKTYGLPYAGEAIALVINKNLVPTPPQTFDEMKSIMQKFHDPANEKFGLSYQFDPYHIYPFITAFGGYWYDDTIGGVQGLGVNKTETKYAMKWFIENILPYLDTSDLGYDRQRNLFLAGKTPMWITGPWAMSAVINALGKENVIVAPIPSIDGKTPKPFAGFRNMYITIMAKEGGAERLYAAVLFVLYVTLNDNAVKTLVDMNGYIPVKLSVVDYVTQNKDKYPFVYGFTSQLLNAIPMPKDAFMAKVWGVGTYLNGILGEYTKALAEGRTVQEAIERAKAAVDSKLDEAYATIVSS